MHPSGAPRRLGKLKILAPLSSRDFRLLWGGMMVSAIGDGIYFVAIAFQVYALSDSPSALSFVFAAWTAPLIAFLLVGGVASDRFERRRVMLLADALRAIVVAVIGVLSLVGALQLWHLMVLTAVYGMGSAFFHPSFNAVVPDLVPAERLLEANSLKELVEPLALRMLGPALAGLAIATLGIGGAILINALTFTVSIACLLAMSPRPRPVAERLSIGAALDEMRDGFRYVRGQPWLWGTFLASTISLLCLIGPLEVLVPYLVKNELGGTASDYGAVLAIGGVGAVAVSVVLGQSALPRRHILFLFVGWSIGTLSLAGFAFAATVWQMALISLVMGALFTSGMIVWNTLMHRLVPPRLLGRVSSLDWFVSAGLIPVSFAITGPIAEAIGTKTTLIGAGVIGATFMIAFLRWPGIRDTETEATVAVDHAATEELALIDG